MIRKTDYFPSLQDLVLVRRYPSEDLCLQIIWEKRYPSPNCPECGPAPFYRLTNRLCYACGCGFQISPLAGTIFEKSTTPLTVWFEAIRLVYVSTGQVPRLKSYKDG